MKGYYVACGYMGWVIDDSGSGSYMLFASEADYKDFVDGDE